MGRSTRTLDMLHGSLWDKLIFFAIPLALTGMMQQLLNAADVAVLGQFVGKNAMAAVGNNTSIIGLLVNLFMGLSLGANVVIAMNLGGKRLERASKAVHTAFLLSLFIGFAVAVLGELLVYPLMKMMEVPADVWDMAETYLRIYLVGMPVVGIYNFESAIFRSRGDTRTPLISLVIASILNVGLNLLFVLYFGMGVDGVVWATVIANAVSALLLFRALCRAEGAIHLEFSAMRVDLALLKRIVRIGLPAGIQGMVFSLSNLVIQSAINSLGADPMAASAAAFTIEINVFCIVGAFGQATTTFVSQNYGAGNLERCGRATWIAMGLNVLFMGALSVFILFLAGEMLAFFNPDPNVVELGKIRLLYVVGTEVICVALEGLSGAMRGYGNSLVPALLTLVGTCGIRITWVYTLFVEQPTFEILMAVYPASWLVTTILMGFAYRFHMQHLKKVRHM